MDGTFYKVPVLLCSDPPRVPVRGFVAFRVTSGNRFSAARRFGKAVSDRHITAFRGIDFLALSKEWSG